MSGPGPFRSTVVGVLCSCLLGCSQEPASWNVLVLVPDTLRADHLSINGYARSTSPHIDALAREGTNFTQAITAAPRTWQSFASILTGLYPPRHGVRFIFDDPLRPGILHLGSALGRRGYATAATAGMRGITGGVGFDEYISIDRPRMQRTGRAAEQVLVDQLFEWMRQPRAGPFLLFAQFLGGHWPYLVEDWVEPFEDCEGHEHGFNARRYEMEEGKPGEGFVLADETPASDAIWRADYDEATRRHVIAHYDAEVRAVDALIGRLVQLLREAEMLETTIVVVTSDHGENFGEHGYLQHGPRVDDSVMRVPLAIRLPRGHPSANPGRRIDGLVRTIDILPTLLDAIGAPVPPQLDGNSLLPAIRGAALPELWAYGESGRSFRESDPERYLPGVAGKHRMIRTAGWKLVYVPRPDGGESRLYDLMADPGETTNLAGSEPGRLDALRQHLESILAAERERPGERELTPEESEELRSLGYL